MGILAILIRFIPYFRFIGVFLSILALVLSIRHSGVVSEQTKQVKIELNGVKTNGKISKNVMSLSNTELDKRLFKWFRD